MLLGTEEIRQALRDGAVVCDPAPETIEGAHIDVRIGPHYWLFNPSGIVSLAAADAAMEFVAKEASRAIAIPPGGFILAHTIERIGTASDSGLVPMLHTRSTLARWGLSVCTANAGQGDIGYQAQWTLEIINPHQVAITIPVGARVGSISFHRVEGDGDRYAPGTRYNTAPADWNPLAMLPRKGNW